MSTYQIRKEALVAKFVIVLVVIVCAAAFAPSADASRTSLRLDAGLQRSTAPAEGATGGTGGANGGSSGQSGSTDVPPNVNVDEDLAQALLDEFLATGPKPENFPSDDDMEGGADTVIENLGEEPQEVSFTAIFQTILSRFRSQ